MTVSAFLRTAALTALPFATLAQGGTPDSSFGTGGLVLTALGTSARAAAVALDASGRAVVVGSVSVTGQNRNFGVARYTPAGALDATFGTGGVVLTDFDGDRDDARGVLIQPDGKIVVAGSRAGAQNGELLLVRFLANGTLDAAFGTSGSVSTPGPGATTLGAKALVIQPDGRLLTAGEGSVNATAAFAVARYLPGPLTGLAEAEAAENLHLFPNPAVSTAPLTLTLDLARGTTLAVHLYDGTGQRVRELQPAAGLLAGPHRLTCDVTALAAGCYWVGVETPASRQLRRLVLTH